MNPALSDFFVALVIIAFLWGVERLAWWRYGDKLDRDI